MSEELFKTCRDVARRWRLCVVIHVDAIANSSTATGLHVVNARRAAGCCLNALQHGSAHHAVPTFSLLPKNFGPVGADHNKSKTAAPTSAQTSRKQTDMKHCEQRNDLIRPHKVSLGLLEQILADRGYDTETDDSCILLEDSRILIIVGILHDTQVLDISGLIELASGSLRKKLRFINWLNNADPIVRFSLSESTNPRNPVDRILLPDATALWGNIALPFRSGFATNQFLDSLNILEDGLDIAFAAAEEDGLLDGANCDKCAEQFETEEDSYAH